MGVAINDHTLLAEGDAHRRVLDLHRLRFASQRTLAHRRVRRQERQRAIEVDLVPDVEETIDHGATGDAQARRRRRAVNHP